MLDEQQLNGIYAPDDPGQKYLDGKVQGGPGKPTPVDPGENYIRGRKPSRAYSPLSNVNLNAPDVSKFLGDRGVPNPENTGQDRILMMGEAQSGWNKLGRRLTNLVPNIAASIIDMVGNVGSLLTEWGDERDYHNALNDLADSIKDPAGKSYARSNDTWALSDPSWWINNAFNLTEMAAGFALGGAGAASVFGKIAGSVNSGFNLGVNASKLVNAAAQFGTSGLVSYAEAAQAGHQVFTEVYDTQLKKLLATGMEPGEADLQAKHIAAQSAATTAQLGTLLTMGINSGVYASFFKTPANNARDIISKRIMQMESSGEKMSGVIRGINAADYADKLFHYGGVRSKIGQMFREGNEELLQQFAQQTGTDMGNKGQTKDFISQFGEIENMIDRVANSQGLFSFVMGAGFGGLQSVLLHSVIPSKRSEVMVNGVPIQKMNGDQPAVDAAGVPVTVKRWVTPRTYERDFVRNRFDSMKEALAKDFENFENINDRIVDAVGKGDMVEAEQARNELFDSGRLHAIKSGMTEPWKKTFQKIADMPPEQAMQAGYITDEADTTYKDRATEAIADMDHLQKVYNGMLKRYGNTPQTEPLIDMVFARHADIYGTDKIIREQEKTVAAAEAEEKELVQLTDPQGFSDNLNQVIKQSNSAREVERQLIEDHTLLTTGTPQQVERLLKKYRAVGYGDGDTAGAIKNLDAKLRAKHEQIGAQVSVLETGMLNSPDYTAWLDKNPGKSFDEFLADINKRNNIEVANRFARAKIDALKAQQDIAKENLDEMTSEKGIKKFSRKVNEWIDGMRQEAEKAEAARTSKLAEMVKDKTTLDRLGKMELNRIAEDYRGQRDTVYDQINHNNEQMRKVSAELKKTRATDPLRVVGLRRQLKTLEAHNKQLYAEGKKLDSLYKEYQVDTSLDTEPVNEEEVTGYTAGKINVSADELPSTGTTSATTIEVKPAIAKEDRIPPQLELPLETDEEIANDPARVYARLYNSLPPALKTMLTKLVNGMLDGSKGFSLDYFNKAIAKGTISTEKALKTLQAANEYVRHLQSLKNIEEVADYEIQQSANQDPQKDEVTISGIEVPETPVIDNTDPAVLVPESGAYHAGYKIVEAATTGATSTIAYEEGVRKNRKGETVYFKVTLKDKLNPTLNEDILQSGKLLPGHPLRYEVDTEYEGPKNITDSLSWDGDQNRVMDRERGDDYIDDNGRVMIDEYSVGNVPIRVMDEVTGKYLFHIRKLDWLEAKFPNTRDYRNVVDTIHTPLGSIDNFAIQREQLLALRQGIIEKFNVEGKATEGQIDIHGKGTGRLILNHVIKGKGEGMSVKSEVVPEFAYNRSNPDKSMLPDPNLTLVIIDDGQIPNSGRNYPFPGELGIKMEDLPKGAVGAMVPASNGQFMYAPLIGTHIVEDNKPSAGLNSIARAIELYLLNDGTDPAIRAEIDNLQSNTGFNVGLARDLRSFISQYYTYLQGFPDSALSPNAAGEKTERFLFNIDTTDGLDKTKQIKAGFSMRGDGVQYANLTNGILSPEFITMLQQGLGTRARAINYTNADLGIKGINSQGTFTDAIYVPGKGWKHETYNNYNEYVKSFSRTPVYGRNQLSDGTYTYTANPHLPINVRRLALETSVIAEPNTSVEKIELPEDLSHERGADAFDDLFNMQPARRTVPELGTGSEKSATLTMAELEKRYNFTPEVQRNGKTVQEVFQDLTSRGHTYLSDGFNPFSRCL